MPSKRGGLESLDAACIARVASMFTRELSPFYDRHDLLVQAATLAQVGSPACTQLAGELFQAVRPPLGAALPGGVTQASTAPQLKAALKQWGLPVTGNKATLWQRLQDEVCDSVQPPPRSCKVSASTRAELSRWSQQCISQARARKEFGLCQSLLEGFPFEWQQAGGFAAKMYLLSDIKAKALAAHGSWQKLRANLQWHVDWREEYDAKERARTQEVEEHLVARGHSVEWVRAIREAAGRDAHWSAPYYGTNEKVSASEAADHIERMDFAYRGPARQHFYAFMVTDTWKPPKVSAYRQEELRFDRAAGAAVAVWAAEQPGMAAIRGNHQVPASLLPELEQAWSRRHQQS